MHDERIFLESNGLESKMLQQGNESGAASLIQNDRSKQKKKSDENASDKEQRSDHEGSRSLASCNCLALAGCGEGGALSDGKPLDDNVFRTPKKPPRRRPGGGGGGVLLPGGRSRKTQAAQDAVAFRRRVWRFRLGSNGDRCSLSPPQMDYGDVARVRLKCLIGSGGFGSVYLGVFRDRIVAVKRLRRCARNPRAAVESFRAECNALRLRHPNIVRVLAARMGDAKTQQEAVLVMEYAGERNMQNVIDDQKQRLLFKRRARYGLELSLAIDYLHDNRVVHLDLKPANVIITPRDTCKLCDFGCSQVLDAEDGGGGDTTTRAARVSPPPSPCLGTFAYRAPELLRGDPATAKADVFSVGITLWQLLTRDRPYAGEDQHVVIFGVVAYNVRPAMPPPPLPPQPPSTAASLMGGRAMTVQDRGYVDLFRRCWRAEPHRRPTAVELVTVFRGWLKDN